ncbi:OLC1v1026033C1 [Oldenlandia corymbosa var. corymbosa]|uniref:OLC1v1026033C1 n=1 Tax=Oldenlandia corymbosa var. corymbosa TaxID=529605 RepID=A0AAV1C6S8_OLDCO|nr:OLC1v1026033C1 [Oldenlandia corymbosa var. corymbosa]
MSSMVILVERVNSMQAELSAIKAPGQWPVTPSFFGQEKGISKMPEHFSVNPLHFLGHDTPGSSRPTAGPSLQLSGETPSSEQMPRSWYEKMLELPNHHLQLVPVINLPAAATGNGDQAARVPLMHQGQPPNRIHNQSREPAVNQAATYVNNNPAGKTFSNLGELAEAICQLDKVIAKEAESCKSHGRQWFNPPNQPTPSTPQAYGIPPGPGVATGAKPRTDPNNPGRVYSFDITQQEKMIDNGDIQVEEPEAVMIELFPVNHVVGMINVDPRAAAYARQKISIGYQDCDRVVDSIKEEVCRLGSANGGHLHQRKILSQQAEEEITIEDDGQLQTWSRQAEHPRPANKSVDQHADRLVPRQPIHELLGPRTSQGFGNERFESRTVKHRLSWPNHEHPRLPTPVSTSSDMTRTQHRRWQRQRAGRYQDLRQRRELEQSPYGAHGKQARLTKQWQVKKHDSMDVNMGYVLPKEYTARQAMAKMLEVKSDEPEKTMVLKALVIWGQNGPEVIKVDAKPFTVQSNAAEAFYYEKDVRLCRLLRIDKYGKSMTAMPMKNIDAVCEDEASVEYHDIELSELAKASSKLEDDVVVTKEPIESAIVRKTEMQTILPLTVSGTSSLTVNSLSLLTLNPSLNLLNSISKSTFSSSPCASRSPLHDPYAQIAPGLCRASQLAELYPTMSPDIVVREARLEDCWEVAETHCSSFFPQYSFPLDFALRIDRLIGMLFGFSLPSGCQRTCLVAVVGSSDEEPLLLWNEDFKIGGFDGKLSLHKGYVAGILTVDTVADFLPRKGPLRQRRKGIAYISNVAVRERFRRRGIGKRLVAKAEAQAKSWGCRAVALHCDLNNPGATTLYKSQGFRCVKIPEAANWPQPRTSPDVEFHFMMKLLK